MMLLLRMTLLAAILALTGCGGGADPAAGPEAAAPVWTCAMHPSVRLDAPGACPICGMDLIPLDAGASGTPGGGADSDRVVLGERARALARVRTTAVQRQTAAADVRLLGRVEPAESTRRNVTTWVGGRIDRLRVNTTGERVRRGEVIATLYSPEVYSAHQDLLTAQAQVERLAGAPAAARDAARAALDAARERLRLLGVPDDELAQMATADQPTRALAIRSPFAGTVIERVATEGAYVQTGATLYRVADLGTLWVQLEAYESDLPRLAVGQAVALTVEALPGETFEGRVAFIEPTVDARKRTARVRVEVGNADGRLRPGLFAEATVAAVADGTAPLVVPATAPLFTGRRSVVYVETDTADGTAYAPRTVRLGPRLGEVYPVVSGLSAGERVVTRGAFAIDADLQIRGGASMMALSDEAPAAAEDPVVTLTGAERATLRPAMAAYLEVQRALAADDHAAAVAAAERLGAALAPVTLPDRAATAWRPVADALRQHAAHIALSRDLEGARGGFEPLSAAAESLLRRFGNPLDTPLQVAFCPMAMDNTGARWVQQGAVIDNAYFGASMRSCGEIRSAVDPGTHLAGGAAPPPAPGSPHAGHQH